MWWKWGLAKYLPKVTQLVGDIFTILLHCLWSGRIWGSLHSLDYSRVWFCLGFLKGNCYPLEVPKQAPLNLSRALTTGLVELEVWSLNLHPGLRGRLFMCFLGPVTLFSSSENSVLVGRFHKLVAVSFLDFRGSGARTRRKKEKWGEEKAVRISPAALGTSSSQQSLPCDWS